MKRLAILALLSLAACKIPIGTIPCDSDNQCGAGQICGADGTCVTAPICTNGERLCNNVCTDITSNTNCGACGNVCSGNTTCISGSCAVPVGAPVISAPAYADQGATGLVATVTSNDSTATYAWTISGGTYANGSGQATGGEVQFNAGTGAVLTLNVVATNTAGEQKTAQATVNLIPQLPTTISITTPSVVSSNQINIPAQATSIANATYAWSITNGILQQTTGTNIAYAAGNSGQITLSVVATSLSGSTVSGQAVIQIVPSPGSLVITTVASAQVGQNNINATVVSQDGVTFAWSIIGGTFADLTASATGTSVTYTAGLGPAVVLSCVGTNAAGATQNGSIAVPVFIGTTTSLTATGGANQVSLRWDGVPGATKYHVLRSGSASGAPTELFDVTTTNTIDPTGNTSGTTTPLPNGKRYYYQVEAATNFIDGMPSVTMSAVTNLPAPTNLAATSGSTIGLTWTGVANATQYTVFRKTGTANYAVIGASTTTSFTDSAGLIEGLTYSYVVHALTADNESVDSNTATAITTLDAPTGLATSVNIYDVTLTWTPNPAATGYDILRSTSPSGGFTIIDTIGAVSTYCNCSTSASPPAPATTYYYEVIATTASTQSVASNVATATTVFPPPSSLSTEIQNRNTVVLSWATVVGATTYSVQRSSSPNGPFVEIAETGNTTYSDTNLPYATTYYYQIVVLSAAGPSLPSPQASATTDASPFRKSAGVFGGEVQAVAFDPNVTSKAWLGVNGGAGIYTSTDLGVTWTGNGAGLAVSSVHSLAFSNGSLFAGTRGAGVYKLAPGSSTWTASSSGLVATDTYNALAADPANSGTVYAATYSAVYLTKNNGSTWTATAFTPPAPVTALAIHPTDPTTVYVATDGAGVYVLHNSGAQWTALGPTSASCQGGIAIDPATPSNLWVGTGAGVFASTNAGQSWSPVGSLSLVRSVALAGGSLFASSSAGISVSTAGGAFSNVAAATTIGGVTALAVSGSTLLAGAINGAGLFRTANSGGNWNATNTGLDAASAPALAVSLSTPSTLYGIAGYNIVKSGDGGATWTQAMGNGATYPVITSALVVDPTNASRVYVGAQGVLRSGNGGATWRSTNANFTPLALALAPPQASALAAASSSTAYAAVYDVGIYKSTNINGDAPSWSAANTGLTGQGIRTVAVAANSASQVYAAGDHGFFTSTDGANTWTGSSPQLRFVRAITVHPSNANTVYAVVAGGVSGSQLRLSTNAGASWTDLGFGSTADQNLTSLSIDPTNPSILFAVGTNSNGGVGGLFKSTDGGTTWIDVTAGLGTRNLRSVALHPTTSGTLFVATDDNGFFVSTSGGL